MKDSLGEKNLRSKIDNYVFVFPRRIHIKTAEGENLLQPDGILERPLRAQTPQGPRVALAKSEQVNAGRIVSFEIRIVDSKAIRDIDKVLEECLKYGALKGVGQWRNASHGRFSYKAEAVKGDAFGNSPK